MVLSPNKVIVLNVAAALVTVAAVGAVARSYILTPTVSACGERYRNVMTFPLERDGGILTAADLQARAGGREAGLLENVEVQRLAKAPAPVGLKVRLPKGSASPNVPEMPVGGMSFPWMPRALKGKSEACLSYGMLLPADFDGHLGGFLPGFVGAEPTGEQKESFVTRLLWFSGNEGGVSNRVTTEGGAQGATKEAEPSYLPQMQLTNRLDAEPQSFEIVRGRWMRIDQEIVLNKPKAKDGVLRVWVDGYLVLERTDMVYRLDPSVTLAGVAADIFYAGDDPSQAALKDASVFLTPFEIRWK